jgi:hypothetical protein
MLFIQQIQINEKETLIFKSGMPLAGRHHLLYLACDIWT